MPQDDLGLRKAIPAERRAALLSAAQAFRDVLTNADRWTPPEDGRNRCANQFIFSYLRLSHKRNLKFQPTREEIP